MGLIEQEIAELRRMQKQVLAGEMTPEMAQIQIGFYNQTAKRVSQVIQIAGLSQKSKKAYSQIVSANIVGGDTAIDVGEEKELFRCPEKGGKCITREDCLDYSGDQNHIHSCQKCEHFTTTRKQLL
jgi:predicted RNA-binding Zn-ribbon protein involved in translation (DUF1610 family)